jgi:hypothetical protein
VCGAYHAHGAAGMGLTDCRPGAVSTRADPHGWSTVTMGPPVAEFVFKYRPLRAHLARPL